MITFTHEGQEPTRQEIFANKNDKPANCNNARGWRADTRLTADHKIGTYIEQGKKSPHPIMTNSKHYAPRARTTTSRRISKEARGTQKSSHLTENYLLRKPKERKSSTLPLSAATNNAISRNENISTCKPTATPPHAKTPTKIIKIFSTW